MRDGCYNVDMSSYLPSDARHVMFYFEPQFCGQAVHALWRGEVVESGVATTSSNHPDVWPTVVFAKPAEATRAVRGDGFVEFLAD